MPVNTMVFGRRNEQPGGSTLYVQREVFQRDAGATRFMASEPGALLE